MVGRLSRVLVRGPVQTGGARWQDFGWRSAPDATRLGQEHKRLCECLEEFGSEVVYAMAPVNSLDAIYVHDPALVTDDGAVLLRPGKTTREVEVAAMGADLVAAGVPLRAELHAPATAEGGDLVWLDEGTLLVGRSYRTNAEGIEALRLLLPDVDVVAVDLVHWRGPHEVFHLMSFMSLLDTDLALVYSALAPVTVMELFGERGIRCVEVASEEFETLGSNVLALGPRVALAADGNARTRRRLERAGVDVRVYPSAELAKGDGGPTCLTRPLLRETLTRPAGTVRGAA